MHRQVERVERCSALAAAGGLMTEPTTCTVNTAKKYLGWMLAALLIVWSIFPEWTGGQYFRFSVLLAALGTLTVWVSLVLFASWVFCVCGSFVRLMRKNHRRSPEPWLTEW
jgi:hypothetical protein